MSIFADALNAALGASCAPFYDACQLHQSGGALSVMAQPVLATVLATDIQTPSSRQKFNILAAGLTTAPIQGDRLEHPSGSWILQDVVRSGPVFICDVRS
jgi:hypothetical protein